MCHRTGFICLEDSQKVLNPNYRCRVFQIQAYTSNTYRYQNPISINDLFFFYSLEVLLIDGANAIPIIISIINVVNLIMIINVVNMIDFFHISKENKNVTVTSNTMHLISGLSSLMWKLFVFVDKRGYSHLKSSFPGL